jgi:hypothetical protein
MADYKLFRSLTLVFALDLVLLLLFRGIAPWPRLLFSLTLFLLAAWRFIFLLGWTYRTTFEYYALLERSDPGLPNYRDIRVRGRRRGTFFIRGLVSSKREDGLTSEITLFRMALLAQPRTGSKRL